MRRRGGPERPYVEEGVVHSGSCADEAVAVPVGHGGLAFESGVLLGMVYDQGKREGERNECEACQGCGRQLVDAGSARARVTEVAGERRRRGPTV